VKYYVEDMFNKKLLFACNEASAALSFLEAKIGDTWKKRERKIPEDDLQADFLLFTERILVSKIGFVKDVEEYTPHLIQENETVAVDTKKVLEGMGVFVISRLLNERNHTSKFDTEALGKTYIFRLQ